MLRKQRRIGPFRLKLFIALLIVAIGWMTWHNITSMFSEGEDPDALKLVKSFYTFEQAGDFGSSWELFHPLMTAYFDKSTYIQRRAHIMMQDFGVKTFEFYASEPRLVTNWRMSKESEPFAEAYEIRVTQIYRSPFGNFELVQPCYAVAVSGEWKMLWSYEGNEENDEKNEK
ncbi:hypothetical protein K0T92_18670 [Paenibacillus oenotherae]|uniref:Uncharacterized protein n=1 Tax=Paenibacillus oenotherae TaxID=1435645 RepID=A0ABS7DA37_9BACL|nr:hypothetical protein [Paenibacillus oenotherae]MBW7476746.1 hypothetical protein [Paenibacillus oenotherae]